MAKFVKIEQLVTNNGVTEMYLNPDHITAVFVRDNLTRICYDDARDNMETTKMDIKDVIKLLQG